MKQWSEVTAVTKNELRTALEAMITGASYVPGRSDPLYEWWRENLVLWRTLAGADYAPETGFRRILSHRHDAKVLDFKRCGGPRLTVVSTIFEMRVGL